MDQFVQILGGLSEGEVLVNGPMLRPDMQPASPPPVPVPTSSSSQLGGVLFALGLLGGLGYLVSRRSRAPLRTVAPRPLSQRRRGR